MIPGGYFRRLSLLRTEEEGISTPAISVIVVNYNGGEYLRRCLGSLALQTFTDFETIVVDNASDDHSLDLVESRPARMTILRQTENHGFARGNNIGAQFAQGDWLALLNPDAEAAPDWLANLLAAVRCRPTHRVVASLQISMHDKSLIDGAGDCYLAFGYAWRGGVGRSLQETPLAGECFAPCGAAAFFPRELFLRVGGFDERYFCYHEDIDLGFRFRLYGARCQFDPACRVWHAGSGIAGRASDFSVFHNARNGVWTYVKNMPLRLLLLTAPVWLLGTMAILARGMVTGRAHPTFRGLVAAMAGMGPVLAARRQLKRSRRVRVVDVAAALAWNPISFLRNRPIVRPLTETADE